MADVRNRNLDHGEVGDTLGQVHSPRTVHENPLATQQDPDAVRLDYGRI